MIFASPSPMSHFVAFYLECSRYRLMETRVARRNAVRFVEKTVDRPLTLFAVWSAKNATSAGDTKSWMHGGER
jgi:hypothetical protein